ncbi:50S ribosomal protein L30 [bacterium]|nr:50S ribosomal protein L30 [bacterium]
MANKLEITLKRSTIGRVPKHKQTAKALGLNHCQSSVVVDDTPQIRGMIRTIDFMVDVREING